MKNFQGWLDFQLYSSHLKNLTKIKQQSLHMKNTSPNARLLKTANVNYRRNITYIDISESRIKNKSQKLKINKQNLSLASRLINVSAVISKDKQIQSYRKYQSIFRKSSASMKRKIQLCKEKKLQKFIKIYQDNYVNGLHKGVVKLRFLKIPKIPLGNQPTVWIELISGLDTVCSSHFGLHQILLQQIKFPLKHKIGKTFMIKLHCSRGLNYICLGEYLVESPIWKIGSVQVKQLQSRDDPKKIVSLFVEVSQQQRPIVKNHTHHLSRNMR